MRKSFDQFAAGDGARQDPGPTSEDGKVTALQPKTKRSGLGPVDDHIADVFAEEHRNDLRYVAAWGKWFEWNGRLWREEKTLRAFDLIRKTCRAQGIERAGMAKMVAPSKRSPAPTGGSPRPSSNGTPTRCCSTRRTASSTCGRELRATPTHAPT